MENINKNQLKNSIVRDSRTSPARAHLESEMASLDIVSSKSDLNLSVWLLMRAFPSSPHRSGQSVRCD